MVCTIYKTTSKTNKINKSLTLVKEVDNVRMIHGEHSILTPKIFIGNVDTLETFRGNYCKITAFGITRYYFITDIGSEKSFLYISLRLDVLMTYKDDILGSTQLVERNENNKNLMIADNSEPIHSDQTFQADAFGDDVLNKNDCNVVLTTAGTGELS